MLDTSHLAALNTRLQNETSRHKNNPKMAIYLDGIRREISSEEAFLAARGIKTYANDCEMSDDELLAELGL
jgi:hypothetical protein